MGQRRDEEKTAILDPGNILFILYVGFVVGAMFLALVVDSRATVNSSERDVFNLSEKLQSEMSAAGPREGRYL